MNRMISLRQAKLLLTQRPVRFVMVGGLNTAFGYTIFASLVLLGFSSALALFIATLCGMIFNFLTTGRLVFANRDWRLFPRFIATYVIVYAFNLTLLRLIEEAGVWTLAAQAVCLLPTVVLSFLILRSFVFENRTAV